MEWYRAYHGACSDAKWPIVARKAKVSVGVVVSVWFALLESASQASERGSVENFDPETVDALYGYEDGTTAAVFSAMLEKGLICDGRICAWDKRQPKREREDNSAARVRQFREKQRRETQTEATEAQDAASVTPCNASETPPEQNREEQTREEIKNTPLTPQGGKRAAAEEYSDDFELFWREYPNHNSGKKKAYSAFKRALKKATLAELLKSLDAHKKSSQWTKDGGAYIPHATTWLNGERWTVELGRLDDGRFVDEDGIIWSGTKYVCNN